MECHALGSVVDVGVGVVLAGVVEEIKIVGNYAVYYRIGYWDKSVFRRVWLPSSRVHAADDDTVVDIVSGDSGSETRSED